MGDNNEVGIGIAYDADMYVHGDSKEVEGKLYFWHDQLGWLREQEWKETRRAIVTLTEEDLRRILDLPDDVHIKWIQWNNRAWQFEIGVYGKRFDQVAPYAEGPFVGRVMAKSLCNRGFQHFKLCFPEGNDK